MLIKTNTVRNHLIKYLTSWQFSEFLLKLTILTKNVKENRDS